MKSQLPLLFLLSVCFSCSGPEVRPAKGAAPVAAAAAGCACEVGADGLFLGCNLDCAAQLSAKSGKPVLVYLTTPWCGPCRELEQKTFPAPEFHAFARARLLPVKVDASVPPGTELAKRFSVDSYPTLILLDDKGRELERCFGFSAAPELVAKLTDYLAGKNTATDLARQAEAAPEDVPLQYQAGRELAIRERFREAEPFLLKALAAGGLGDNERASAAYLLGKNVYLDGFHAAEKAVPVLEKLLAESPGTWQGSEAVFLVAGVYGDEGKTQAAEEFLTAHLGAQAGDAMLVQRLTVLAMQHRSLSPFAVAELGRMIEREPAAANLWKARGELLFHQGRLAEAERDLEKASSLEPANEVYSSLLKAVRKRIEMETQP